MIRRLFPLCLWILFSLGVPAAAPARGDPVDGPPFSLPFAGPAGPNTWLYEQHYGNTTGAYNFGADWYASGQGMHFGIDLEAPCGTPILAIADGVVAYIDSPGFGAGPHSLVIDHPGTGYASLYGHLYEKPTLERGQTVKRGEVIAHSGDPDGTCESRPHLHLEIRSADYQTTYNPTLFIHANWHMLASIGPEASDFQQDLDHPRRWMRIEDQPTIQFGGPPLNNYMHIWPPRLEFRAPANTPPARHLDSLPGGVHVVQTQVSRDEWSVGAWWQAPDNDSVYLIDAVPGQETSVFRQPLDGSPRQVIEPAPPALISPDGTVAVRSLYDGSMQVTQLSTGQEWEVYTDSNYPAVSPDGRRLLYEVVYGSILPGTQAPGVEFWVKNIDGSLPRKVYTQSGGWSLWLDAHRLLIVKPITYAADVQLYILDIDVDQPAPVELGHYRYLRGIQVAPGGQQIAFYLPFQQNPGDSGLYVLTTEPGSTPRQLDFFGAYQWRDDTTLYVLSFDSDRDTHALGLIDTQDGSVRMLTDPAELPIRVANGEWSVSPDGTKIVYLDPADYDLYLLTMEGE